MVEIIPNIVVIGENVNTKTFHLKGTKSRIGEKPKTKQIATIHYLQETYSV
jgi:hypothetical protein